MSGIEWELRFYDNTLIGWSMVVLFFIVAAVCILCAFESRTERRRQAMWMATTAFLFLLAVNKQLDLHNLARDIFRMISVDQGWFGERRLIQATAIYVFGILMVALGAILIWRIRKILPDHQVLSIGLILMGLAVFFQASAFHHVLPLKDFAASRWLDLVELIALCVIAIDAVDYLVQKLKKPQPISQWEQIEYSRVKQSY